MASCGGFSMEAVGLDCWRAALFCFRFLAQQAEPSTESKHTCEEIGSNALRFHLVRKELQSWAWKRMCKWITILYGFGSLYLWPHKEYSFLGIYNWGSLKMILYNYEFVFWLQRHYGAKQISKVVNYCGWLSRKISCSVISRVYFSGTTLMVDMCFEFSACPSLC